eukprot:TRINITY_DN788_c0_g1_i1.p1 TRINITY_DN788_c0_g1~~TRINITY_DN788_c0_g1_i1.p1  ORF type:complete len:391 (-),score=90.40 TRINITY_DN788_c0_g1_i1:41-1213(-)
MEEGRRSQSLDSSDDESDVIVATEMKDTDLTEREYESTKGYKWIDICGTCADGKEGYRKFLKEFSKRHNFHPNTVKNCMLPNHLPKMERTEYKNKRTTMLVTRLYETAADQNSKLNRVQDLTNKLVILFSDTEVVTIHRRDIEEISNWRTQWTSSDLQVSQLNRLCDMEQYTLLDSLIELVLRTFVKPMAHLTEKIDIHEVNLFAKSRKDQLEKLYNLKRRASVFKRVLKLMQSTIETFTNRSEQSKADPSTKSLNDQVSSLLFTADGIHDEADNLINLYVTVAAHRTNELMTLMTTFTAFFVPLTFVAGIYGMNFENMPELTYQNGYFWTWGIMGGIIVLIYFVFFFKGLLPAVWDPNNYPGIRDIPYLSKRRAHKKMMRKEQKRKSMK